MNKKSNNNPRSSRLPQLKLKPPIKFCQENKENSEAKTKKIDKTLNIFTQKSNLGTSEEGNPSNDISKTLQTIALNTFENFTDREKVKNIGQEIREMKTIATTSNTSIKEADSSKNSNATLPYSKQVKTLPNTTITEEINYNKVDVSNRSLPSVTGNPVISKETTASGYSSMKKMSLKSISIAPNISTVVKEDLSREASEITRKCCPVNIEAEREVKVPASRLDRVRNENINVGTDMPFLPTRKRKIEGDKNQDVRNVRMSDFSTQEKIFQELRTENIQIQYKIEKACIAKAALIDKHTLLENEKTHLQREKLKTFAQVCQLEHKVACENVEMIKLLDEIVERKSDIQFLKQENADLFCERENYEKQVAAVKKQFEESVNSLAKTENELREIAQQLERKISVNDAFKAAVDEIMVSTSAADSTSTSHWNCNIL